MMQLKKFSAFLPLATLAVGLGSLVPSPAWAGFLWVAPTEAAPPLAAPAPVAPVQAPQAPLFAPTPSAPPPSSIAPPVVVDGHDAAVSGFARNVPLVVALRQILPADVGFSVDPDVSLGTLVSWEGGGSWRDTVRAMLQPSGLLMRENGRMVTIGRAGDDGSKVAPVAPVSVPVPVSVAPVPELQPAHVLTLPPSMTEAAAVSAPTQASSLGASLPVPTEPVAETWSASHGDTLRKVLEDWSRHANVELIWQAEYDYPVQASLTMTGTFEEAVRSLLGGFSGAQPQPIGTLHNGATAGQLVLVVQARGNNYSD